MFFKVVSLTIHYSPDEIWRPPPYEATVVLSSGKSFRSRHQTMAECLLWVRSVDTTVQNDMTLTGFGVADIIAQAAETGHHIETDQALDILSAHGSDIDDAAISCGNDYIADHLPEWIIE